jgi:capsular exopolysaccharide synthesis family protein
LTVADYTTPNGGHPPPPSSGDDPAAAGGGHSGDVPEFRVANLLRMQQRLLTSGGRGNSGPAGPAAAPAVVSGKEAGPDGVFGLQDYIDVVVRRRVYLLLPLVLVPMLALFYTVFQQDEYEAASRLLLTRSLVGQGIADDMFASGGYVTSTAFAQVAKLERVRKQAADSLMRWVEGDDSVPLARLWAGKGPALPDWQTDRVLAAIEREGLAIDAPGQPEGQEEPDGQGGSEGEGEGKEGREERPEQASEPDRETGELLANVRWTRRALASEEYDFLASPDLVFAYISGAVDVLPDTQNVAVVLTARSSSPIIAAAATDAMATAMVEEFERLKAGRSSVSIIRDHLAANEGNLKQVNEDIARLRHEAAVANEAVEGFPLELERQYDLLKSNEFTLRSLAYMIEEGERKVELLRERATRAANDVPPPEQLIQRLIDLELKHDEYVARYKEKHPRMQKLLEETERTRRTIQEYSARRQKLGVGSPVGYGYYDPGVQFALEEAKLVGLKARKERLAETVAAVRGEIEKSTAQERSLRYELLQASRKVLQDTAVALRTRLHRAELIEGVDSGPSGGAVEAVAAEVALVGPHRFQTVFLGVIMGLLAGVLLALLAERLDETVRLPAEVRTISGLPTLQVIPHFRHSIVIRPEETVSGIANTFAVLRNHIRYSAADSPERCVLITSATSGEGKSLLAVNLAISFAQEGNRTCLVDADVQKGERHALEEAVKLAWEPQAGLAGFLDGVVELDQVLVPCLELSNLSFIGSGGRSANPPRALRSERARSLFESLQNEYDVVITDAPPLLPVVDAAILSGYCRAVIQVVRHGFTRRGELEESVRRLRHVGAPVVGMILNGVPGSVDSYYEARRYRGRYGA